MVAVAWRTPPGRMRSCLQPLSRRHFSKRNVSNLPKPIIHALTQYTEQFELYLMLWQPLAAISISSMSAKTSIGCTHSASLKHSATLEAGTQMKGISVVQAPGGKKRFQEKESKKVFWNLQAASGGSGSGEVAMVLRESSSSACSMNKVNRSRA